MCLLFPYFFLIIGLVLLIKGADLLVDGASSIARKLNISDLVIGLTVVAFGTSTPELFVSVISSAKGNTDIAIGNIIGSNIANIFLIMGISAVIFPLAVSKSTVWKEIPFSLLAALVFGILANDLLIDKFPSSVLTRSDGIILLCCFVVFLYYTVGIAKKIDGMENFVPTGERGLLVSVVFVVLGLVGLGFGGKWIVDGAVDIALRLGMSESTIGLTIVAVGTSLPELASSAMAAYKKNVEIAVGNIVGSNIFNILFVLGISSVIKPLPFQEENNIDTGVLIAANVLLFVNMFTGGKHMVDRWEGAVYIVLYAAYTAFLVFWR